MSQNSHSSDSTSVSNQTPGRVQLPTHSTPAEEVMKQLHQLREKDANWYDGRTFSLVYHRSDAHTQLLKDAYGLFFAENALNPSAFPSLRRMEN
ncbi:MAG TPA: aspartate aminotransferase family protein, partial [Pseudomonadota bacterium]|nr:aspartate aminotransferase family protein [Pseudomonadota bacterium]